MPSVMLSPTNANRSGKARGAGRGVTLGVAVATAVAVGLGVAAPEAGGEEDPPPPPQPHSNKPSGNAALRAQKKRVRKSKAAVNIISLAALQIWGGRKKSKRSNVRFQAARTRSITTSATPSSRPK